VDHRDRAGASDDAEAPLAVVSQVDDRLDAVALERRPAVGRQPIERVAAHHRPEPPGPAVVGWQATEVTHVEAAGPVQRERAQACQIPPAERRRGATSPQNANEPPEGGS
jgi:hypothetical protein